MPIIKNQKLIILLVKVKVKVYVFSKVVYKVMINLKVIEKIK